MALDKTKLCHQLKVTKKISETADSVSLVLEVPNEQKTRYKYKAGQFITLFLDINGEEVRRSYSLASSPDSDAEFKITVKQVSGGKGSTHLVQKTKVGDILWATPPAGLFCLPEGFARYKLIFYAAGSGITPVISMIKSALALSPSAVCHLIYQNKNKDSVIFKSEIESLEKKFAPRFKVEHVYFNADSASLSDAPVHKNFLREFYSRHNLGLLNLHFLCGPSGFMQPIESALLELSVDKTKIHKENFTSSPSATITKPVATSPSPSMTGAKSVTPSTSMTGAKSVTPSPSMTGAKPVTPSAAQASPMRAAAPIKPLSFTKTAPAAPTPTPSKLATPAAPTISTFKLDEDSVIIGDRSKLGEPKEIVALIDGETHTVPYKKDATILECLLDAGLNPPYSCMAGSCMACMAKIKDGLAHQNDMGILSKDNVAANECLTCQARPASKKIIVDYNPT